MQISALQRYFGVKLINVKKRKVYLTKAGERLFLYSEEIYRSAMEAESFFESYRNDSLRIGISGALARIIDLHFGAEEFLHRQMEVMHETGIVDDTRIINVTETDLYRLSKRHELISSFMYALILSAKSQDSLRT
jgi:hypothetical protein